MATDGVTGISPRFDRKLASESSITLAVANAHRRGLAITNEADTNLRVKRGSNAALDSYSVLIPPNAYWEMPTFAGRLYTGIVTGIWETGVNTALEANIEEML